MSFLKLEVFIPKGFEMTIIEALHSAGFLREGAYDYCYATSLVKGHFRPLGGAQAFMGEVDQLMEVDEIKLECRIPSDCRTEVDALIRLAHPYEIPVMNFMALVD